jgi:hypothetical protein
MIKVIYDFQDSDSEDTTLLDVDKTLTQEVADIKQEVNNRKRGQIGGPKPKFSVIFKGFSPKRGPAPSCRLCTQSGVV